MADLIEIPLIFQGDHDDNGANAGNQALWGMNNDAFNNTGFGLQADGENSPAMYDARPEFIAALQAEGLSSSLHCGPLNPVSFLSPPSSSRGGHILQKPITMDLGSAARSNNGSLYDGSMSGGYASNGAPQVRAKNKFAYSSAVMYTIQSIVAPANITLQQRIGKGTFSEVYRGASPDGLVAVKVMLHESQAPTSLDQAEVALMQKINHPHIVQLIDVLEGKTTCVILEYCAGGDLYTFLHKKAPPQLSVMQHLWIMRGVAEAINYLHSQGIIHRDIKSPNCLLAQKLGPHCSGAPMVKIADFGLSRQLKANHASPKDDMTKGVGSTRWMAPEVYTGTVYGSSADVYSFGMFMYEVMCHKIPYGSESTDERFGLKVCRGLRPKLEEVHAWCTGELRALMTSCWNGVPQERPKMKEVVDVISEAMKP